MGRVGREKREADFISSPDSRPSVSFIVVIVPKEAN